MNIKYYLRYAFACLLIVSSVVVVAAFPFSCRLTEDGLKIVSSDSAVPKIVSFYSDSSSSLALVCSQSVIVSDAAVKSDDGTYAVEAAVGYEDGGKHVLFSLPEPTQAGSSYALSGVITDESGNSLSFSLPFTGFNSNPARLLLTEVRSKHSSSAGAIKKSEFVELYVLKGGSLAALELVTGSDGEDKKYAFPAIDVRAGEYIVVHFRTVSSGECVDELGGNLKLSTGTDSSGARDFWIDNTESRISDNDVIIVRDSCRNLVIDALLYSASSKTSWYYKGQKSLSAEAFESGVWQGGSEVEYAAVSDGITLTRTMSRLNVDNIIRSNPKESISQSSVIAVSKDDWAVVKKATPGEKNSSEVYIK